jgi:hypothetical protein
MKTMIRALTKLPTSYRHHRLQDHYPPFEYKGEIAIKNLVRGLLFALELEAANAILKLGVFTSFLTGATLLSGTSSISIVNNFIFFIALLSVRIGINQGLRRT